MNVTSVNVARVALFFPAGAEITIGRVPFQDATKFLCERYEFAQYPKTLEDWQKTEGAIFGFGKFDKIVISGLVLYARGFAVATQTSTDDCERVAEDLISTGSAVFGLSLPRPAMRRVYYSELTFV